MICATPLNQLQTIDNLRQQQLPLVTIITVVRNGASLLPATILSVISQTYPHIEYIVIDGGSTDGTSEIIQHYAEAISIVVCEEDRGIYDAMNKGIKLAHGQIIGLLNAGDCYQIQAIANVVAAYQNSLPTKNGDCVLIAAGLEVITNSGLRYQKQPNIWEMDRDLSMPHPSLFVSKDVFQRFGLFAEKYTIAADYDFVLRTYRHCQILLLTEVTTTMSPLGTSSNFWLTATEAHRARLANGVPWLVSYFYFSLKRLRICLHLALEWLGLWPLVESIGKQKI
jgi:glycosyltransferase involved in cell wall biosynthesis